MPKGLLIIGVTRANGDNRKTLRYPSARIYLFQDAFRCAAVQFGVETNHPEFVGLGTMVTSRGLCTRSVMHSNEPRSGSDLTMPKADAADSNSTVRKHRQRGLIPWKPGQSGNPKGRPKGSRNRLCEDFVADPRAWQAFGKAALMTAAWTEPSCSCAWLHR